MKENKRKVSHYYIDGRNNDGSSWCKSYNKTEEDEEYYPRILSELEQKDKQKVICLAMICILNADQNLQNNDSSALNASIGYLMGILGYNESEEALELLQSSLNLTYQEVTAYIKSNFTNDHKEALNWLFVQLCNEREAETRCEISRILLGLCGVDPIHLYISNIQIDNHILTRVSYKGNDINDFFTPI